MNFVDKLIRDYEVVAKIISDRERAENMKKHAKDIMTKRPGAPRSTHTPVPSKDRPSFLKVVNSPKEAKDFQKELTKQGKVVHEFNEASIHKTESGFELVYEGGQDALVFKTQKEAEDHYYVQLAYDNMGSGIRDNSKAEKIQWGKDIEEYGTDDEGYPANWNK